jgi:3-hydroxyisobutyrate dehydrogenase-like beta-hydroxyacid dehydrogenase
MYLLAFVAIAACGYGFYLRLPVYRLGKPLYRLDRLPERILLLVKNMLAQKGLRLGETLGVDRRAMREMLLQSSGQNWALESGAGDRPMPWAEKDMMIVLEEADAARMSLPLCGVIKEVIKGIKVARGE